MLQIKLIRLYYYVCHYYTTELRWQVQRFSPNSLSGRISDQELLTIYLFAVAFEHKCQLRQIYDHIHHHWQGWFPGLGSYQNFAYRLNRLSGCLSRLTELLTDELDMGCSSDTLLVDSLPIVTCSARRRHKAADDLLAKAVASVRQPIESLVNWLQQKTNIQDASKVRSEKGLNIHILGKVAAALVALIFNS